MANYPFNIYLKSQLVIKNFSLAYISTLEYCYSFKDNFIEYFILDFFHLEKLVHFQPIGEDQNHVDYFLWFTLSFMLVDFVEHIMDSDLNFDFENY